jgi:integrase
MPLTNRVDALLKLDAFICLRRSKLLGLKYSDIDTIADTITVRYTVQYNSETDFRISSEMKTEPSRRVIPFFSRTHEIID